MILVHTYYPAQNGVQAVTQYIAEGLAQNGNQVMVVTALKKEYSEHEKHNDVDIRRIIVHRKNRYTHKGDKKGYYQLLAESKPDVLIVVGTQIWPFDWLVPMINEFKCKKILYTHGYPHYAEQFKVWPHLFKGEIRTFVREMYHKRYFDNLHNILNKFDLVTYLSETDPSYRYAQKWKLNNGKVLGNAVENAFWEYDYSKEEKNYVIDKEIRFFNVANYGERKNQKLLLEAFYKLNVTNAELILIGNARNEYYDKLLFRKEELDSLYGEKKVQLLYGLSREEVIQMYRRVDAFVMTSTWEGYPICLCEAAASGLPIISTDVGNAKEFNGIIIICDKQELIAQMEKMASSPDLRREKGSELRKYAEENCEASAKVEWLQNEIDGLLSI